MTRSPHPLVDLLARLSASSSAAVAVNLADYVTDAARRSDTVAALREVTRCPSCGCDVEACPPDERDACATINSLPTHGEVMAMPGHEEAERREHPSEPPSPGVCPTCNEPLLAGPNGIHCDQCGWEPAGMSPLPAGEGGNVEGWESPADMATRVCAFTLYEFPRLTVEERDANERGARAGIRARDAATSARLLALLAEPGTPAQMAARLHGFARVLGGAK